MATNSPSINENLTWNESIKSRNRKAEYYFETILGRQYEWYCAKADVQKNRHYAFAISVIVLGALISLLQVVETADWQKYLTAALGAAISVIRALDGFLHPGDTWQAYRKASENMKRELRLYVTNADAYTNAADESAAYRLFVERVELVLAEEQQLYWQNHTKISVPEPATEENQ